MNTMCQKFLLYFACHCLGDRKSILAV